MEPFWIGFKATVGVIVAQLAIAFLGLAAFGFGFWLILKAEKIYVNRKHTIWIRKKRRD